MKSCGFLLRIILAIIFGICVYSCSCDAASLCPVRAIPMNTPEGVQCVCEDTFFGKKCQFRADNSFQINAEWTDVNDARVQWQTLTGLRDEQFKLFKLFIRKLKYDGVGVPIYGKWKAGMKSRAPNEDDHEEVTDRNNSEGDMSKEAGILLRLDRAFTWEIRVIMNDDKTKSAGIFIDPPLTEALALQNNPNQNSTEEERCPWYRCPEQEFGIVRFFKDFSTFCFKKGIIVGLIVGIIGTVIISSLVYITIRYCCCKKKFRSRSEERNRDIRSPNSSCASVAIEMPDLQIEQESCNVESHSSLDNDNISVCSLFVTLPEPIEVVPKSSSMFW